jgi:predicted SnoaL-like aldol condensation-catalyzing enzyme
MRDEYVKTISGKTVGIIRSLSNGDKVAIHYPSMRTLGYYRATTNMTTDLYGRLLNRGDSTMSLIWDNATNN